MTNLFKIVPFRDRRDAVETDTVDRPEPSPDSWRPPADLLENDKSTWEFASLRQKHAGYEVSSYSRMKRAWIGALDPLERDEFRRDSSGELVTP